MILSCACTLCVAQDSFRNPNRFRYLIEYSTEYTTDSIKGVFDVTYDVGKRMSSYILRYDDGKERHGIVKDKQLDMNRQVFRLEKFFEGKYDAQLAVSRKDNTESQKVAFIYYSNPSEDTAADKTCICLILEDYDPILNATSVMNTSNKQETK